MIPPFSAGGALSAALAMLLQAADTTAAARRPTVSYDDFRHRVAAHHPVARQARLLAGQAREELRTARGAFDPTLSASWDRKTFAGTEYYDYTSASLTVPTPLGADLKLGYERADGRYISPDRRTPGGGLVTAGLSVPLGQRVLTDERRTAVAVARALRDVAEGERVAAVNKLLLDAAKAYAGWYESSRRAEIAREGVTLAEFRLQALRRRVAQGEAAPIDTVEALVELQRRVVQQAETEQARFAASLAASAFLWDERGAPVELPPGAALALPDADGTTVDSATVATWLARAERGHPELRKIAGRVEQARAQRALTGQQMIPFAEAQLGTLGGGGELSQEDAKAGVSFRTPLLFMRERGRLGAASLVLERQRTEEARLRREVAVAVRTAANELAVTAGVLGVQRLTIAQTRLLRDGEQRRFESGESTLFLVNARERAVLEEEAKLVALEAKLVAARAALDAAVGDPLREAR